MDFKRSAILLLGSLSTALLVACGDTMPTTAPDENLVGTPVQSVSGLTRFDGSDRTRLALFDETTRKIQQFNLSTMTRERSYTVDNQGDKHNVVLPDSGNYVIDLSKQNIAIYTTAGVKTPNPINLVGKPLSIAFNQQLNLFLVYDDLNNVGLLQLDASGTLVMSWVGGPVLNNTTIQSGEIMDNGNLILAMSDGSLAVVNVSQTLQLHQWVVTSTQKTGLSDIVWVSKVNGSPTQVLMQTSGSAVLYDYVQNQALATVSTTNMNVEKYSKNLDSHILYRSSSGSSNDTITLLYAANSNIVTRSLHKQAGYYLASCLDLTNNSWSAVISASPETDIYYDSPDITKVGRTLVKFRVSDLASLQAKPIPDQAQTLLSSKYVFALFPSELGYAVRINQDSWTIMETKFFNMPQK